LVEAGVGVEGIGEVGAEGKMPALVLFNLSAGEEGELVEGGVGGDADVVIFFLVEAIGGKNFFEQRCKFCVLEGAQAGGVEGFFVGDVVAGGGHEYSMRYYSAGRLSLVLPEAFGAKDFTGGFSGSSLEAR